MRGGKWNTAILHAFPVTLLLLGMFTYWFGVADRYAVFLYEHLGATPFDAVTRGRYWMAGLIATGIVLVLYVSLNWFLGQMAAHRGRPYCPPAWLSVWALCVLPLVIGIPLITMTLNEPTLPLGLAVACLISTLAGLALALLPGRLAATKPMELVWLAVDGAGLVPILLLLKVIELPATGLRLPFPPEFVPLFAVGIVAAGVIWLGVMTLFRRWRRRPAPGAVELLLAGFSLSYLLMPLIHYLLATPSEYRYISAASNFFAASIVVQIVTFGVATALAIGAAQVRLALNERRRETAM